MEWLCWRLIIVAYSVESNRVQLVNRVESSEAEWFVAGWLRVINISIIIKRYCFMKTKNKTSNTWTLNAQLKIADTVKLIRNISPLNCVLFSFCELDSNVINQKINHLEYSYLIFFYFGSCVFYRNCYCLWYYRWKRRNKNKLHSYGDGEAILFNCTQLSIITEYFPAKIECIHVRKLNN